MGRKILLVTTDQQRYDTLGCNGGTLVPDPGGRRPGRRGRPLRTGPSPVGGVHAVPLDHPDRPAPEHPRRVMNGVPLPDDAPSVAEVLRPAGYRTALVGKAHFEPYFDPFLPLRGEPAVDRGHDARTAGPRRGFEHLETASPRCHGSAPLLPVAAARAPRGPRACTARAIDDSLQVSAGRGGDTGAPQVKVNPIDRGIYHTDWVADRTIAWLDSLDADEDWFCWMSFPDPHHPWDPPESEVGRIDWREVPLPGRLPRGPGRPRGDHRRQAPPLAGLVRRDAGLQLRGPGRLGAGHADRRPGPRGQRPQRRRGRADRRGAAAGCWPGSPSGAGPTTWTWCSPPTTASCRATSACCSRARTTWTP